MLSKGVTNQRGTIPPAPAGGAISGLQELPVKDNLDCLHMWTLFHSTLHSDGEPREARRYSCELVTIRGPDRLSQSHRLVPTSGVSAISQKISANLP